jgi:hypothetical protein
MADLNLHAATAVLIRTVLLMLRHRLVVLSVCLLLCRAGIIALGRIPVRLALVVLRSVLLPIGAVLMPGRIVIARGDDDLGHAGGRRQECRRRER